MYRALQFQQFRARPLITSWLIPRVPSRPFSHVTRPSAAQPDVAAPASSEAKTLQHQLQQWRRKPPSTEEARQAYQQAMAGAAAGAVPLTHKLVGSLVGGLCRRRLLPEARAVLERAVRAGRAPREGPLRRFLGAAVAAGRPEEARPLVALYARERGWAAAAGLRLRLAAALAEAEQYAAAAACAEAALLRPAADGAPAAAAGDKPAPPRAVYNAALSGLARARRHARAREVFEEMKAAGVRPDATAYNVLLGLYARQALSAAAGPGGGAGAAAAGGAAAAAAEEAAQAAGRAVLELYEEMRRAGVAPTARTYNALSGALCRAGNFNGAITLLHEMKAQGLEPDVVTYNCLVNGAVRAGRLDQALRLLERMEAAGVHPNLVTYNTVLGGYLRNGEVAMAEAIVGEMVARNKAPDETTYQVLIGGLFDLGEVDRALAVFDGLRELEPAAAAGGGGGGGGGGREGAGAGACRAGVRTYNLVLRGLVRAGRRRAAWRLGAELWGGGGGGGAPAASQNTFHHLLACCFPAECWGGGDGAAAAAGGAGDDEGPPPGAAEARALVAALAARGLPLPRAAAAPLLRGFRRAGDRGAARALLRALAAAAAGASAGEGELAVERWPAGGGPGDAAEGAGGEEGPAGWAGLAVEGAEEAAAEEWGRGGAPGDDLRRAVREVGAWAAGAAEPRR